MPPNTKKCDHKEIGYVSNGGSGLHPVPVCKNCNASVFFKPTPTPTPTPQVDKQKYCPECVNFAPGEVCKCPSTPTPAVEDWEKEVWSWITKEMPHKHADRFIPLFEIIHSLRESDRKRIIEEINHWKASSDIGSQEIDRLYLHLKSFITNLK